MVVWVMKVAFDMSFLKQFFFSFELENFVDTVVLCASDLLYSFSILFSSTV
jgi:hypothetical protein